MSNSPFSFHAYHLAKGSALLSGVVLALILLGSLFVYIVIPARADASNLIVNGDFEAGNVGFTTGYEYVPVEEGALVPAGTYTVLTDPADAHPNAVPFGDHTSGAGLMMAVNGATVFPHLVVWSQTVQVLPNSDYVFSAWIATWTNVNPPAQLQVSVNNVSIGIFNAPSTSTPGVWQPSAATWNSASSTSANIEIISLNTAAQGNDFALDDLSFALAGARPLLDRMVWNAYSECPFCTGQQAVGWAGGPINTLNGNLSYEETDFSIPTPGGSLEFRRSYASQAVDTYTSLMGFGWTHNYDMRLVTSGTVLPDTVEFQAPGGSRLPFFVDDSDPNNPTFDAYPGVTAELVYIASGPIRYELTAFNQYIYRFRDDGRVVEQEDPAGNKIGFAYNAQDQLAHVYSLAGPERRLDFAYANGRLQSVTDDTNRVFEFIYHPTTGDLWQVIDPLLGTTTYNYQGSTHLLTEVIDPSGRIVEKTYYDAQGRAYEQENGAGETLVTIEYDVAATGGITENVVMENGVTAVHGYDNRRTYAESTPLCIGEPGCGETTAVNHDNNFKANYVQDANGNPPTELEWNNGGSNLERVTNGLDQTTLMSYDESNNLTDLVDALDNPTQYKYEDPNFPTFMTEMIDALGNSTFYVPTTTADGIPGLLKSVEDPNGRITTYEYNGYGQVMEQVVAAGTPDALTTTYEYDALGRLVVTTQSSASESYKSLNAYDAGDRLVATIENWTGSNPATWQNECIPPLVSDENICTQYDYDGAGRLIMASYPLGQIDLMFYDDAGRPYLTVANWDGAFWGDPLLHLCDFATPDPEFNICAVTEYDQYGRVVTTTNSLGHLSVTEYDSLGRVSRTIVNWVDGIFNVAEPDRDLITEYEYDAVGNVLVVTDPLGRKTRTFYNELNQVSGVVENWDGAVGLTDLEEECGTLAIEKPERDENICTLYQYDPVGNNILVTNTLMQNTRTFYDELNRVAGVIENWDGMADLSDCVLLPGNTDEENICTFYGYDDAGNQITTTNALNQTTLTVYDAASRPFLTVQNWDKTTPIDEAADCQFPPILADVNVCTLTTYDGLGRRVSTTDPMGSVTEYAYDGLGRLETITRYLDGLPVTDHIEYDALGNRLSTTNANGHTTTYEYDSLNRLVQSTTPEGVVTSQAYNAASWVITSTDGLNHSTVMGYDFLGRRTSVADPEGNITLTYYDALGNQVALVDAEGVRTGYSYDGLNRLTAVTENDIVGTDPSNQTDVLTQYHYDSLSNRVVITNALGFTSSHTLYDDLSRPVIVRDGLGNETRTAYNALGLSKVITDANSAVTLYGYDGLNHLTTIAYQADDELVLYELDATGNRLAMYHATGTTTYQYDDLYRLTTVTNPFDAVVVYEYDRVGNRTGLTYPDDRQVVYTYDGDNRLIQVEDWDEEITSYHYDEAGRLSTTTLPNGIVTFYTYDDANRLTLLQHVDSTTGESIARYEYELDKVGNRTAVTETLRLPTTPGAQASLPAGLVSGNDAPLTAADAIAAIQPPDVTLDKDHLSRPPLQGPPPPPTPPPPTPPSPPPFVVGDESPLTSPEELPFDVTAVLEKARNQVQTGPNGQAFIHRPGHRAAFAPLGSMTFAPVLTDTQTLSVTLDPAVPLTISLELAAVTQGTHNLPINPAPGQQEISENLVSQPRGPWLVEEFIARDGGIEQRWRLPAAPPHSGDLRLALEATTALSLTLDGDGFVFHAPTTDGQMLPVVRYGRALAIDAVGDQRWADLSFTQIQPAPDGRHRYRLTMAIPADWLATAQYPLLIDPLLSNLVRLEQTAPANDQSAPEVAYNPDLDEFLLVWQDYRNGNWDIYAQRVNGDGALLDENFIVNNSANQQSNPQIAYGGGVYLVAWRHYPPATYYDVRGAIISGTGQILFNNLGIATNSVRYEYPTDVIFNNTSNQFLVLWHERGSYWNVSGRHVAPNGTMGTAVQITPQASPNEDTAVGAYNPENDEYLIVWQSYTGSTRKVTAQRLTSDGVLIGSAIDIGDGSGDERNADVIYLAGSDRYVIAWQDTRNNAASSHDVYGQRLHPDGTLDGNNFIVANATVEESNPHLALDASTGGVMVVWQRNNGGSAGYDLYGRLLDSNGLLAGDSFVVETADTNQQRPVLAANVAGDTLVAWHDNRNGNWDIFMGMKLAVGGWGGVSMAHPAPGAQEKPQIAYNPDDDEYLVVWQDYRSSTDWDIYGQRVDGDGSLLGPNIAIDTTATRHQLRPQVAYGANEYLVAWQHYTNNNNTMYDVYGRVVNRNGSLGASTLIIANYGDLLFHQESPTDIAYNSTANQFLVVWETEIQYGSGAKDIWARHVAPSGTMGGYIQVATSGAHDEFTAVAAYNPDDDQYLVVWDALDKEAETEDVIGRRVTGSGTVMTGDNILISTAVAENALPDVLYHPDSDRYIVAWQQGGDVYSRGVLPTGAVAGVAAPIADTSQWETNPRLTADLIIWQRQNSGSGFDLYARPLDSNGLPAGESFVIQETAGNQQSPAIANGSNQRTQLAWQDDATGPWDLLTASLDRRYQVTHIEYDYDPLYRLVNAEYSGDVSAGYTYIYDAVGNMTAYEETIGTATTSVNRTFNAANQLLVSVDSDAGSSTFTYDNNGNLERINLPGFADEKLLYAYNQRNLLTLVSRQFGSTAPQEEAAFVYDGDGNRLQQIDHTGSQPVTTTYTNDIIGLSQVLVSSNGTTTTYNLFGLDLISQDDGSQIRYLLTDGLGSTRIEMVGSVVETTTTYEPYGKLLAQTGASGTVYGFTGEQQDDSTGFLYLRARYYSPQLYTFLSGDPWQGDMQRPSTLHGYGYTHNNPVNYVDPTGYCIVALTGELRLTQYPLGTSGYCPNPQLQTLETNNSWDCPPGQNHANCIYNRNIGYSEPSGISWKSHPVDQLNWSGAGFASNTSNAWTSAWAGRDLNNGIKFLQGGLRLYEVPQAQNGWYAGKTIIYGTRSVKEAAGLSGSVTHMSNLHPNYPFPVSAGAAARGSIWSLAGKGTAILTLVANTCDYTIGENAEYGLGTRYMAANTVDLTSGLGFPAAGAAGGMYACGPACAGIGAFVGAGVDLGYRVFFPHLRESAINSTNQVFENYGNYMNKFLICSSSRINPECDQ